MICITSGVRQTYGQMQILLALSNCCNPHGHACSTVSLRSDGDWRTCAVATIESARDLYLPGHRGQSSNASDALTSLGYLQAE